MSYKCNRCEDVCEHKQIKIVTERRENNSILKEEALCQQCSLALGMQAIVFPQTPKMAPVEKKNGELMAHA